MTSNNPEGMIPVEEFARQRGTGPEKVVQMIKDGAYVGQVVGDRWFVEPGARSKDQHSKKTTTSSSYESQYETGRKVATFISFLGWLFFVAGLLSALAGLASGFQDGYGGVSIIAMLPGLGIAVSGLFLVASGQVTRATVDNADHTREILALLREKGTPVLSGSDLENELEN